MDVALDLGYLVAEMRRVSVFGVFLIATGMYHGGKNIGVALGLTSGQK